MTVISAFPGTGKTFLAGRDHRLSDSDSSSFSWESPDVRHPDWPANYVTHVRAEQEAGRTVLCSTHQEVRCALADAGIPFALVYPSEDQRVAYIERFIRRGSPPAFIDLMARQWEDFIQSCRAQRGCAHFVLGPGRYLFDCLPGAIRECAALAEKRQAD